jgi:hypothetical protein
MADDPVAARHQLAILSRRKSARALGWPREWRPYEIVDPKTGEPFTDATAWELVADLLEDPTVAVEEVLLESPPGKRGYVIQTSLNARRLYVKVQLGSGKIIGRSFHYSEH